MEGVTYVMGGGVAVVREKDVSAEALGGAWGKALPRMMARPKAMLRLVREPREVYEMAASSNVAPCVDAGRSAHQADPTHASPSVDAGRSEHQAAAAASDHLEDLGDEICTLSAHIHAATHRLLTLLAEFDELEGWRVGGHRSCAYWLAFRTGIDLGAAREKVRAARTLRELPATSGAMSRGELSFAKVRALTRVATPDNEGELLEFARKSTAAQLERMVRGWKLLNRKDEAELERIRHESRGLSVFPGDDGMYVVRGRLDPEVGALLMRAVEAAGDALYRGADATPGQCRADALALLAERALAAGFGGSGRRDGPATADGDCIGPDGLPDAAPAEPAGEVPVSGTRAERYQVVLHVEADTLKCSGEPGISELEDGIRVSAETSRRLTCDASVVKIAHAADGSILDVGRRTRTIPPAIRRALDVRDRGCRWPGCGSRFADAHHVVHWADGGPTKLDNLVLLCPYHHRLLHEEGYGVELNPWPGGRPVFYDPRGVPLPESAPIPRSSASVGELINANRRRSVDPDWRTAGGRWKREGDIPNGVLDRLAEAFDPKDFRKVGEAG